VRRAQNAGAHRAYIENRQAFEKLKACEDMNGKIDSFTSELQKISEDARATFGTLSAEQINWKPSAESWSVGQCFDHLITTNSEYFAELEDVAAGRQKPNFWTKVPFLPGFFGNFLLKAVAPENPKKNKAPKPFRPSQSEIDANIISEFVEHQKKVKALLQNCEKLDLEKTVITSPVAKFVVYNLKDAFNILVLHERRHFQQAERVMQAEGFPK
jgi:hypothetical protein